MVLIGQGGFSRVFQATRFGNKEPKVVAVKVMKVQPYTRLSLDNIRSSIRLFTGKKAQKEEPQEDSENEYNKPMDGKDIVNELLVWKALTDKEVPFIIKLLDELDFGNEVWAVMELGELSILEFLIQLRQEDSITLGSRALRDLMSPIFIALSEMHALGYVHRDIKPENIIITSGYVAKLTDFGSTKLCTRDGHIDPEEDPIQTLAYAPPEATADLSSNQSFDTWSLLMTFYTLLIGISPWDAFANLNDVDAAKELAYTVELMRDPVQPLDRNAAQEHLYVLLGLVQGKVKYYMNGKEVVVGGRQTSFIDGVPLEKVNLIEDQIPEYMYNDRLDAEFVAFMLRSMKLLVPERPRLEEVCRDPFMARAVDRYRDSTPEKNTTRLHQRIYRRKNAQG